LTCSPAETLSLLTPLDSEFSARTRYLKPSFWRWRAGVRARLRAGADSSHGALRMHLEMAREITGIDTWFSQHRAELDAELRGRTSDDATLGRSATAL